jgi:hypothetical protein
MGGVSRELVKAKQSINYRAESEGTFEDDS